MKRILYIVCLAVAISGCKGNAGQPAEEHAHDAKLQLTSYGSDFEVYAEVDPFVVVQNAEILAHFTWLNNFKPLESGSVTVSLIVGGKGIKQTLEQPTRTGIFKFTLQPETAGEGKITFTVKTDKGESEVTVSGIKVYTDKHDAEHAAEDAAVSSSSAVPFIKEQSWKLDFATDYPKEAPFGQIIKTTAKVESAQGNESIVTAKTSGVVTFSGGVITLGKAVQAGQQLFSIASSGFADNNISVRYAESQSNYNRTKADYERKKELAKDKIVSEKELHEALNAYQNAEAVYNNLNKNFSSGGQTVTSPMSGFVKQLYVTNGQYVEAGQPVAIVSQNKNLFLTANVQPKYLPLLNRISSANIRTLSDGAAYTLEELNGKLLSYGKSAESDNYVIPVTFQVDNRESFVPGGFVDLYIKTVTNTTAISVPNGALTEEIGNYFVFVQLTPELFEKREVKIGVTDGIQTEITNGIRPTERLVTKGAILLKLAAATGSVDAHSGHVH
ncbi:Toluene efflux pump periplasmic linker protein TtgG [termite gut metagenome]|uniref:Toluene efflux pump periplasmic linker protein TtgG n=1 Tax=termite gut metagenome TaxID=433724 RepID=A0A5J4SIX3_9ZZZZ